MAIDWPAFLDAVKRDLGSVFRRRPREAPPAHLLAEPSPAAVVADPVRLADGTPAEIGKMVVFQPGPIGTRRLGATLLAVEVDPGGKPWLVLGIVTDLPLLPGYHWLGCPKVDPQHCWHSSRAGANSLRTGDCGPSNQYISFLRIGNLSRRDGPGQSAPTGF